MELRKGCALEGKRVKLDLKENSSTVKKAASKCPYYRGDAIEELSNEILASALCSTSEVILHASTRAAWGIDLKGNVLVLDEAHNVLETIGSLYSTEVTSVSTTLALSLIREYLDTYKSRLKSKNLLYMKQLLAVVGALDQYLRKNLSTPEEVLTIQGLVIALGLTEVNLFKIVHYMESTDMCRKFHGFFIRSMKSRVSVSQSSTSKSGIGKLMAPKKL
ncbi:hypothetical protein OSTOST_21833, partial [Ostertagia ostertagi]